MTNKDAELKKIADKFKDEMGRLGLGVSIKVGDGPMVTIVDPPEEDDDAESKAS